MVGTVAAATVALAAYIGIFCALGLVAKRSLVWGLLYIFIWEGFVATAADSAARLAVRTYARSVLMGIADVPLRGTVIGSPARWIVPLMVGGAALGVRDLATGPARHRLTQSALSRSGRAGLGEVALDAVDRVCTSGASSWADAASILSPGRGVGDVGHVDALHRLPVAHDAGDVGIEVGGDGHGELAPQRVEVGLEAVEVGRARPGEVTTGHGGQREHRELDVVTVEGVAGEPGRSTVQIAQIPEPTRGRRCGDRQGGGGVRGGVVGP